jgi:hypothetical protein
MKRWKVESDLTAFSLDDTKTYFVTGQKTGRKVPSNLEITYFPNPFFGTILISLIHCAYKCIIIKITLTPSIIMAVESARK